jgi:hypothetical protein
MAAVLAVAEVQPVTGAEALTAFMLGVEAACRLSKAISVAPANGDIAWSQTGVTSGVAAALAAARLMKLDLGSARMAAGIAAAGACGIRALHGSMCTAALPAFAGQSGLRAALLAKGGFTATQSVIEARYGLAQCFARTPHLAYLSDGLGTHWEILANTYKPFPCGIVIHPLIEAALEIAREQKTSAGTVARVEIIANPAAMALCYRRHRKDEMEGHVSLCCPRSPLSALLPAATTPSPRTPAAPTPNARPVEAHIAIGIPWPIVRSIIGVAVRARRTIGITPVTVVSAPAPRRGRLAADKGERGRSDNGSN